MNALDIRKGPYYADVGDLGSVGALDISLIDSTPRKTASLTIGSFGYRRTFGTYDRPLSTYSTRKNSQAT